MLLRVCFRLGSGLDALGVETLLPGFGVPGFQTFGVVRLEVGDSGFRDES